MELTYINETKNKEHSYYSRLFRKIIDKTIEVLDIDSNFNLSVILVDDEKIHEINKQYRNIDRPTDVISFALQDSSDEEFIMEGEPKELGDIFISVNTAIRQAEEYNHSLKREMGFLFTHGLLHLLGYDHMNDEDEKIMISLQKEIIDVIISR